MKTKQFQVKSIQVSDVKLGNWVVLNPNDWPYAPKRKIFSIQPMGERQVLLNHIGLYYLDGRIDKVVD